MKHRVLALFAAAAMVAAASSTALAHCQIPCGIYNDPARFTLLEEHVTTIEKSMKQIQALSAEKQPDWNQIVRWVGNKESHADQLTEIVTFYFMAQRVKPPVQGDKAARAKYVTEVTALHQIIVHAMKAKQTTDLEHCAKLRKLIADFKTSYLGEHAHAAAKTAPTHTHQ